MDEIRELISLKYPQDNWTTKTRCRWQRIFVIDVI
jgi:hypothetical protein